MLLVRIVALTFRMARRHLGKPRHACRCTELERQLTFEREQNAARGELLGILDRVNAGRAVRPS